MCSGLHYFHPAWIERSDEVLEVDVCVYGGNAAGVVAGIKALRLGMSAVVLQPGMHLGGMTTGGLGWTDYGRQHVIGGMSRRFYEDLGKSVGMDGANWHFWPSDAERLIKSMVKDTGLDVRRAAYLDTIEMNGQRLVSLTVLGGLHVKAKQFIDCSYEGDLLAKAGVSYTIGRESNAVYGETLNGVQCRDKHQFTGTRVDPYMVEGDAGSGLLPGVESRDLRQDQGQGDHKVQAYNFRVCMTNDPALMVPWEKPAGYEALRYEPLARWYRGGVQKEDDRNRPFSYASRLVDGEPFPQKIDLLDRRTPTGHWKSDTNNHGPVSSDFIGANHEWPTADYAVREAIFQAHVTYQKGLYWFLANDERVPDPLRSVYAGLGLPSDEFTDTGHWPHQLYPREARRMVADHVITEHDCTHSVVADDPVGMGSYTMDSHNCSRFVAEVEGQPSVLNEGDVQVPPTDPYGVSLKAIVPKAGECENLVVPVCFSASHIAYGSARMEPVFMVLGESAACVSQLALRDGVAVQGVAYDKLRVMLDDAEQVLSES
ncbi:MAG: FAD-dependent oxidoreductase [Planctomycetota bacterium]